MNLDALSRLDLNAFSRLQSNGVRQKQHLVSLLWIIAWAKSSSSKLMHLDALSLLQYNCCKQKTASSFINEDHPFGQSLALPH